jgi:hypothetical protein
VIDLTSPLQLKDILAPIATFASALAAIIGVLLTVRNNRKNQMAKQAHDAYDDYLKQCFANAKLADGLVEIPTDWNMAKNEFLQYEWLVARLLSVGEEILEITNGDREWRRTIENQVKMHKAYLSSQYFGQSEFGMYSEDVRELIANAVGIEVGKKLKYGR